jgi:hypothetical protein
MHPLRVESAHDCPGRGISGLLHVDGQMDVGISKVRGYCQRAEEAGEGRRAVIRYHHEPDERHAPVCRVEWV